VLGFFLLQKKLPVGRSNRSTVRRLGPEYAAC